MEIIGRLFRRVAGQLDNPGYEAPPDRHGEADCYAACISSDWLQSIRSVGEDRTFPAASNPAACVTRDGARALAAHCSSAGLGNVAGDFRDGARGVRESTSAVARPGKCGALTPLAAHHGSALVRGSLRWRPAVVSGGQ